MDNLMPNLSLYKNSSSYIQPIARGVRGFMPFPKVLVQKWTAQLEFEIAYYNVIVQHIAHYIMGTPPLLYIWEKANIKNLTSIWLKLQLSLNFLGLRFFR